MQEMNPAGGRRLETIPVLEVSECFALDTVRHARSRLDALMASATHRVPRTALKAADAVSRRWLVKWNYPYLAEIDEVARAVGRPGAYFLSVNYEWGCTAGAKPAPDGRSARLVRVLDWRTPGLGRNIIAARIHSPQGMWVSLTWPGYTGALQAMAPRRFSAALNQAPMANPVGFLAADWAVSKFHVWRQPHLTPAHLLRRVFEVAPDFAHARRMLIETPICAPGIFTLAGLKAGETCVIERRERDARTQDGHAAAANQWQGPGWVGRARGQDNPGRLCQMAAVRPDFDPSFAWLRPPILNPLTRLVLVADAAAGRIMVRGHEADGPATEVLDLVA
jgi:hypothetical protein